MSETAELPRDVAELRDRIREREVREPTRHFVLSDDLEVREEGDEIIFQGEPAVFDRLSEDLGGFRERFMRGAFRRVLDRSDLDVRYLFNHNPSTVMARTLSGTLELRETPKGLRSYARAAPTSLARDLQILVKRRDITGQSFGFTVAEGGDVWLVEGDDVVRTVREVAELFDVGPATYPAYPQTNISSRALVQGIEVVSASGDVCLEAARGLAWRIHRGEAQASADERAVLDAALARAGTVTPWIAERALRAVSQEPELQAAVQGMRATVTLTDEHRSEGGVTAAARARALRLRTTGGER